MSLPQYGVLKGTIVEKLDSIEALAQNPKGKPHYQLKVDAGGKLYRIAINVKSDQKPANLQVFKSEDYKHPILDHFQGFGVGYTHLASNASSGAMDFIRSNLFDINQMVILPASDEASHNDLNDIFDVYVKQAMQTEGALVYAFGSLWQDDTTDPYFGFKPGDGIHDIHMNQGNEGSHAKDNGVYQDGAFFIYYPDEKRYLAMFLKFQSQHIHTDDTNATPIVKPDGKPVATNSSIVISAALINPKGVDTRKEQVYLLNTSDEETDLNGWAIIDKAGHQDKLAHIKIGAGEVLRYTLSGKGAQLSNNGGTITLLNKDGLKVSGVAYTAKDAAKEGQVTRF